MYKIEEPSLKLKNHKRFTFRPKCIHTGQKTGLKISCDSPFKVSWRQKGMIIRLGLGDSDETRWIRLGMDKSDKIIS
jgi:hypothetical protein